MTTITYATNALRYLGLDNYTIDIRQHIQNVTAVDVEYIDVNAMEREYRARIQAALPQGLTLEGNAIHGTLTAFKRANREDIMRFVEDIDLI